MDKYISFGQFNKKYFFILGSLTVKIIMTFISGFTPYLTPKNTIYIFGFKSNFFSHPLLSYCLQYFSLICGGIIIELIFRDKKKEKDNNKNEDNLNEQISKRTFSLSKSRTSSIALTNYIYIDRNKNNDCKYFTRIFFVYSLYYLAKITMSSFDNIGYNRVKYWPLEFIFLYLFAKKIMNKVLYKHQILSLTILLFACTAIYIINSFIPQSNKDCSSLSGEELEECKMLSVNVYNDISNKFGWYFIPIIILIYLVAMISNAYSSITNKWFMDIKYITLNRILIYVGCIGLCYSLILLFVLSYRPCSREKKSIMSYVCKLEYQNDLFYDNYRTLSNIEINSKFYIDVFILIPVYIVSSFLSIFFELLIIKDLDPFYLIPIDSTFFLIYEIIDYCVTYPITNLYRNLKFVCQFCSNFIDIILCLIYLEIIELHFCSLDKQLRRTIIKRVQDENKALLNDGEESVDSENVSLDDNKD